MNQKLKIVITDEEFFSHDEETEVFCSKPIVCSSGKVFDGQLIVASCKTGSDIAKVAFDADAVLVNQAKCDKVAISAMEKCKVISRYGVGVDNVDAQACKEKGIRLVNVPGYCCHENAEHALGFLLALNRGIIERDKAVRNGKWIIPTTQSSIASSVVGIVGFGAAGQCFAKAVCALNPSRVLIYSPHISQKRILEALPGVYNAEAVDFDTLLSESDFISIHIALSDSTRNMFNKDAFSKVKKGVCIANTARGGIINSNDLAQALQSGIVGGAGLDVLDIEPPPVDHPLFSCPNVIFSDHSAYRSSRSIKELKHRCALEALKVLQEVL